MLFKLINPDKEIITNPEGGSKELKDLKTAHNKPSSPDVVASPTLKAASPEVAGVDDDEGEGEDEDQGEEGTNEEGGLDEIVEDDDDQIFDE